MKLKGEKKIHPTLSESEKEKNVWGTAGNLEFLPCDSLPGGSLGGRDCRHELKVHDPLVSLKRCSKCSIKLKLVEDEQDHLDKPNFMTNKPTFVSQGSQWSTF